MTCACSWLARLAGAGLDLGWLATGLTLLLRAQRRLQLGGVPFRLARRGLRRDRSGGLGEESRALGLRVAQGRAHLFTRPQTTPPDSLELRQTTSASAYSLTAPRRSRGAAADGPGRRGRAARRSQRPWQLALHVPSSAQPAAQLHRPPLLRLDAERWLQGVQPG